jgi:hypothetical protein
MKQYGKSISLQPRPFPKVVKTFYTLTLFLLLITPCAVLAADPEMPDLHKKKILQTELDLAKKGKVYAVLDFSSQQVTLKIKGLVLKEFHLSDVSSSKENPLPGSAHRLIKKHPPAPTLEKEIPPAGTSDNSDPPVSSLLATETVFVSVADMPSRYRLYFEDGLMISIAPSLQDCDCGRIERGLRLIKETAIHLSWEAGRLVVDRRFPDLRLTLSEGEAKALFWSLSEGSWLLVQSGP